MEFWTEWQRSGLQLFCFLTLCTVDINLIHSNPNIRKVRFKADSLLALSAALWLAM